jgi:acyl carrier protein
MGVIKLVNVKSTSRSVVMDDLVFKQLPQALIKKIYQIIIKITNIPEAQLDLDKNFKTEMGLDSLQLIRIASAIEEQLNIELPVSVMEVNTLKEFLKLVTEELYKNASHY